jgi:opacity protein-like surface antigen
MRSRALAQALAAAVLCVAVPRHAVAQAAAAQPVPPPAAQPRRFELMGFGGWAHSSDVHGGGRTLNIGDATSWGAAFGVRAPYGSPIRLKWVYSNPTVQLQGLGTSSHFNVPTNYFLVEGEKGFRRNRVEPFVTGALGAVAYAPGSFDAGGTHYSPDVTWRVAFGLGGGLNLFLSERIAVRLGAEVLAPIFLSGGGFYIGSGGASVSVSGGVPTVTANFTLGLTIRL